MIQTRGDGQCAVEHGRTPAPRNLHVSLWVWRIIRGQA